MLLTKPRDAEAVAKAAGIYICYIVFDIPDRVTKPPMLLTKLHTLQLHCRPMRCEW
jgi:hypothetical protein